MRINQNQQEFVEDYDQEEIPDVEFDNSEDLEEDLEDKENHYPAFLNPVLSKFKSYRNIERTFFESDKVKKITMGIFILVFITVIIITMAIMH